MVSGTIDDDARLPTSPFNRQPDPTDPTDPTEARPRDSDPYLEMEVSTERDHPALKTEVFKTEVFKTEVFKTQPVMRVAKTVPRRLGVGSGPETAIVDRPDDRPDDRPIDELPRAETRPANPHAIEESSDAAMAKLIDSLSDSTEAEPGPKELKWVGVVVSAPEVGASLLIGTWLRKDFRVTTPVEELFTREDGVLVQTATKSRYFVKHAGDVYLVRY